MKKYSKVIFGLALLGGFSAFAGSPAAPYDNTRIDARLNVAVKEGTQVVHFVRDTADPNVITKAYEVKYADPYELRSYLRSIVQTRKVTDNNTNVETVTFSDGSALVLISAEDYRFDDTKGAQGFDSIVKELDKPKLYSSSGRLTYVYSPKYRSSADLLEMIQQVGLYNRNVVLNNIGGTDVSVDDPELNLIFFRTTYFSKKIVMDLFKKYDRPEPVVRAKVTVYELYAENDTKLGIDFQTWKNNEGIDLFSAGGRFSQNHNGIETVRGAGWNKTTYFQFNPKWNTKYIDFLTGRGKAKVLHTSEMTIGNNAEGKVEKFTEYFVARNTPAADKEFNVAGNVFFVTPGNIIGTTGRGQNVSVTAAAEVSVCRTGSGKVNNYTLKIASGNAAGFTVDGVNAGNKIDVARLSDAFDRLVSANITQKRGNTVELEKSSKFGFSVKMTPVINTQATKLKVQISNSSLIGYTSDGSPRIQKGAEIDTEFVIANSGTKLVIGGIEKRSVMKVSGGIPLLKDIPVLGLLFSTETTASKRSQLLVVAEIVPENKGNNYSAEIKKINAALK